MTSQYSPAAHRPTAEWIGRFAGRTLNLSPHVSPLDAVRRALEEFPASGNLDPEETAEASVANDGELLSGGVRGSVTLGSPQRASQL
jgi:hypothetical protein